MNSENPKLSRILELLDDAEISYRSISHEPTLTSEDSARARGESLETGGKALLLKAGDRFAVFVLSAALKLDSHAVKKHLGSRSLRFATADELMEMTQHHVIEVSIVTLACNQPHEWRPDTTDASATTSLIPMSEQVCCILYVYQ